jgi:hypothetical protein
MHPVKIEGITAAVLLAAITGEVERQVDVFVLRTVPAGHQRLL